MNLDFVFGSDQTSIQSSNTALQLNLKSTVFYGPKKRSVLPDIKIISEQETQVIFENKVFTGGIFLRDLDEQLADTSYNIYQEVFKRSKGYTLCRAWNFIPKINETMHEEEVYRIYNKGRSKAFYEHFKNPEALMPAAVGIDIHAEKLIIAFLATKNKVSHFENPLQISAFKYPKIYGQKAPSFARASSTSYNGKKIIFVSGTASIRGHETVHSDDLIKQIDTTMENIQILLRKARSSVALNSPEKYYGEKIIFLRNKQDLERVQVYIREKYPQFSDATFCTQTFVEKIWLSK